MRVAVIGIDGFIGKSIVAHPSAEDWEIVRDLRPDVDRVIHLGAPSSHEQFKWDMDGAFNNTINTFLHTVQFCKAHEIPLVYASSITVYNPQTPYAKCKQVCELISSAYKWGVGVRIACGYGPNENHKGEYASVLYKFCKDMRAGKPPVIWGDGSQTRDFIYQDDIAGIICEITSLAFVLFEIYNLTTGIQTSFSRLAGLINEQLGSRIWPVYVDKPQTYIDQIVPTGERYSFAPVTLGDGIKRVLESL